MRIEDKSWLNLGDNEEVLYWCHPSLIMYANEILVGVVVMLAGLILPFIPQIPYEAFGPNAQFYPLILVPIGLVILLVDLIRRKYRYYVVTTHKVVHKWGIPVIGTTSDPIKYDRMVNIKQHRGFWEYIASFVSRADDEVYRDGQGKEYDGGGAIGDLEIQTADDSETLRQGTPGDMYLDDVPDVGIVKAMIEDGMDGTPNTGRPGGSWGGGGGRGPQHNQPNQQPPQQGGRQQGGQQPHGGQQPQGNQQGRRQPQGQRGGQQRGGRGGADDGYPDQ